MQINIEPKIWDSEFFQFQIWSGDVNYSTPTDLDELIHFCISKGIKLVYLFPKNQESIQLLKYFSIPLIDEKVVFKKNHFSYIDNHLLNIEPYNKFEQYDTLYNLALDSGVFSRFKTDCNFKHNEFKKLYKEWLDRSIEKEIADDILVWKDDKGIIKGFITYKVENNILIIGLIAVDRDIRGTGVGSALIQAVENVVTKNKINEINAATQLKNLSACKFYQKNSFIVKSIQPIFHLWIKE